MATTIFYKPAPKEKRLKFNWPQKGLLSKLFFLVRNRKPWHDDIERHWADGTWLFEMTKHLKEKFFRVKVKYSKIDGPITRGFSMILVIEHGSSIQYLDYRQVRRSDVKEADVVKPYIAHVGADGNLIEMQNVKVKERFYTFEWRIGEKVMKKLVDKEGEPSYKDGLSTALVFKIKQRPLNGK